MADADTIRRTAERSVEYLKRKPDRGFFTGITKARVTDGLRCAVEEGEWTFAADMPAKAGGDSSAPTPGVLGRGALASCLAIGIATWAARLDVPLDSVEVEVQADFNARGELGMDPDIPAGYTGVRYTVSIDSPADAADVRHVVATAERHSPYLDVFGRAQRLRGALQLRKA